MAAPSRVNDDHPQRHLVPAKPTAAVGQLSGDLVVMAALIGISRAFFGRRNTDPVKRFLDGLQEPSSDTAGRGRQADTPSRIPAKGWKDIAWRINQSIQDDRVLLLAAGSTFCRVARTWSTTSPRSETSAAVAGNSARRP